MDPQSPLPRKLRTLVIAVDGRTSLQSYVRSLSSFGDVTALLEALAQQGYIAAVDTDPHKPERSSTDNPWSTTLERDTERSTQPMPLPSVSDAAFESAGIRNSDVASDDVSSWDRFQSNPAAFTPPVGFPASRLGAPPSSAQYQLRSAISLMSDFVTTHLPADCLEIALTLESLSSVEQVIASLKGYQAMIAPAGSAATRHMDELRALLSRR